ncbi:response regulator [Paenibacillus sepulcri]|uniref:Response regulator n=1 Tax=Paenibacillus sepulcri TaxID=359917 RepID=A0ABS7C3T0_9BACL|nr:response regulator [Paenibacillus sepulcri]
MAKLLIVEDESLVRDLIKKFVAQAIPDMEIIGEADNGEDGLRMIQELNPDIVITDMKMPLLDGIELLRILDSNQPNMKVIVLSGYDDYKYMHQALRSGAVEYLLKPVDPGQLTQALQLCLKELQHYRHQLSEVLVTLPPGILAILNDYKKNAAAHLNELAIKSVEDVLTACISHLDSQFDCGSAQWLRIYHEFLITLEQFTAMEGLELNGVLKEKDLLGHMPSKLNASDVLEAIKRIYREAMDFILVIRRDRKKVDLQQIFDYVQQHYADDISLGSLAQRFYVSREYLSKSYKLQFRENIMEQIIRLRMQSAKSWVMKDDIQIKHIAKRVGYEDASYFDKVFKKYYGVSPSEMRK